jgi:hypothetical protein
MKNDDFKKYYNTIRPFHLVKGCGTGSVTILIRKNFTTWLYRLFIFGEVSRYVKDSRGSILIYNKISEVAAIIDRKRKVHSKYNGWDYDSQEWAFSKYNEAWSGSLYAKSTGLTESVTDRELIKDPYCFWVKGYKAHFVLEKPTERRKHFAYYKPI